MKGRRAFPMHVAIAVWGVATTGCSWTFVHPVPPNASSWYEVQACTSNPTPPVLDTVFSIAGLISAGYVAQKDNVSSKGTLLVWQLSVAALWGISAGYGYSKTSECAEAKRDEASWFRPPPTVGRRARPAVPPSAPFGSPEKGPPTGQPPSPPASPASPQESSPDAGLL
jgi:hypothetical protein